MDIQPAHTATGQAPVVTVGVVADTHIPDRVRELHPGIIPALRAAGASHILHAGDICVREVLDQLGEVAPVTAVRGNRDVLAGPLNLVEEIQLGGVRIALMHGHGGLFPYLWDKWKYLLFGYRLERYLERLNQVSQEVRVVVFGHTHHPEIHWRGNRLLFNPGSASFGFIPGSPPAIGLLHIGASGQVQGEIVRLGGWKVRKRNWIRGDR